LLYAEQRRADGHSRVQMTHGELTRLKEWTSRRAGGRDRDVAKRHAQLWAQQRAVEITGVNQDVEPISGGGHRSAQRGTTDGWRVHHSQCREDENDEGGGDTPEPAYERSAPHSFRI
jgi:hypothetical protein